MYQPSIKDLQTLDQEALISLVLAAHYRIMDLQNTLRCVDRDLKDNRTLHFNYRQNIRALLEQQSAPVTPEATDPFAEYESTLCIPA